MRIATVIGNRPQFVKAAAVSTHLRARHAEVLIHTGQHYDDELSAVFFRELGLPAPDHELGVAPGETTAGATNSQQTARMLERVVDGEIHVGVALVLGRRAADMDITAGRQREVDLDLIEAAGLVAASGRLEGDPT